MVWCIGEMFGCIKIYGQIWILVCSWLKNIAIPRKRRQMSELIQYTMNVHIVTTCTEMSCRDCSYYSLFSSFPYSRVLKFNPRATVASVSADH